MFSRPEHRAIAAALGSMDRDLLLRCKCWFGGGTALVLGLGEYRLSKDIDFLCADPEGYRDLRSLVVTHGAAALFGAPVREERAFRCDQYGIRGWVRLDATPLRFEIIREARIVLEGRHDDALGVAVLLDADAVAEKLLANADRGQDRAFAYRDALDLGMVALRRGPFPDEAVRKAVVAYGEDVRRKLDWVIARLGDSRERAYAAATLGMTAGLVDQAVGALASAAARDWS